MTKKKLYLVKREVFATSVKKAMMERGTIYEIQLADEKYQPQEEKESAGFKTKKSN